MLGANRVAEVACFACCGGSLATAAAITVSTNHRESVPTAHAKLTAAPKSSKRRTTCTFVVGADRQSRFLTVTVVAVVSEGYAANLAVGCRTGNQSAQNVKRRTVHQSAAVGATILIANTRITLDFVLLSRHTMCVVRRRQQLQ